MNISQVLFVIVYAQLAVDRSSVDFVGFPVDRGSKMFEHVMSFHEVRHQIGPFIQLIDAVYETRLLTNHQIALVV